MDEHPDLTQQQFRDATNRLYRQFFDSVARIPLDRLPPPAPHHPQYRPPFFAGLVELLGNAIPKHQEYRLDPVRDCAQIAVELGEAIGQVVTLPPYAPTPGSLWNAVIMVCAACRIE